MKKCIYCITALVLMGCSSMQPLELKTSIEYKPDITLQDASDLASEVAGEYADRSREDYKELVKADQYLLHAAAVGIIGVASSAHADVLTTASLFGGYVGAQKAYTGPLGKAKLYLEAASAAQCVEKHAARLIPEVKKLDDKSFSIFALQSDLNDELSKLKAAIGHFDMAYARLQGKEKEEFDSALAKVNLGGFSSFDEIYQFGKSSLESIQATIRQVEDLPFLIIDKLQQIDLEVTRRFITETVDIDTVIATLKQGQSSPPVESVPEQQSLQGVDKGAPEGFFDMNDLQLTQTATQDVLNLSKQVVYLSNLYASLDLSPLTKNANSIKSCVVATVQVND